MVKGRRSGNTDTNYQQLLRTMPNSVPQMNYDTTKFAEFTFLPIYYNNVRSIANKQNLCMNVELSLYQVLVMTETWLKAADNASAYFPKSFNVYRFDRSISFGGSQALRRSGGVAVLVRMELNSRRLTLTKDEECESVAIEVRIKPTPLIIYAVYMKVFNYAVAMKHVKNIKRLCDEYRSHRIMVLGDFNMESVRWIVDDTNRQRVPI